MATSGVVETGGLELGAGAGRDPDVLPGGWDRERRDPGDLLRIRDPIAARVDIPKAAFRAFSPPPSFRIIRSPYPQSGRVIPV